MLPLLRIVLAHTSPVFAPVTVVTNRNIRGPFMTNRPEGRERLQRLLSEVMIRHTKSDVLAIPPPTRESALLAMSQQEALAYDTIVSFVRWGRTALLHVTRYLLSPSSLLVVCYFALNEALQDTGRPIYQALLYRVSRYIRYST